MIFTPSVSGDIERYYYKTWVKLPEFGDKLFFIQSVGSDKVSGVDDNGDYFELLLDEAYPYEVDYVLPHKSVFQWKDSAVMLQRIPARQYRRGLCEGNTQIINCATSEKHNLTVTLLKAFVTKKQYSPFSAAFAAKSKLKSVALSPRMWFHRGNGQIYMDRTPIASYSYDTKKITILRKIFKPEIMQHMVDHNETYEVVE